MNDTNPESDKNEIKGGDVAKEHAQERREQKRRHKMLGWFLNLYLRMPLPVKIIFLIFGLLYSPAMVQNLLACIRSEKTGRLRAISGPEFIYFYMAGAWGLIFCVIDHFLEQTGHTSPPMTWLYLALLLFTFITVGLDFKGGSWFGVLIVAVGLTAILGWYGEKNQIPLLNIFGSYVNWVGIKTFPRSFVFALSVLILVIYLFVWIRMNFVHVLKIEGNYVQVWTFASRSPKDTRASFSLVPDYDDINEAILGFACRLNMRSKSRRISSHEFPNMPGGPVVEQIATHLLNAQEVQVLREYEFEDGGYDGGEDDD